MNFPLDAPLLADVRAELDRVEALLVEDQALRHAEYDRPDPKRRRLRVACNDCETPWCCNQRVAVELVEALVIYRHAAEHAPRALQAALERGEALHARPPLDDAAFFRKKMQCPFLDRGRCTIFAVRPHRCRTHYMAGNPQKCRNELQPSETYEMSPDRALLREIEQAADDVRFALLLDGAKTTELAETLYLIDRVARGGKRWKIVRTLDWDLAGDGEG